MALILGCAGVPMVADEVSSGMPQQTTTPMLLEEAALHGSLVSPSRLPEWH